MNILAQRQARFDTASAQENKFDQLEKERAIERQKLEQSNNNTKLIGTCQEMCPEFERHERELHLDLSIFEMIPGTEHPTKPGDYPRIDHDKAVKKYHRPAAGNEQPLPSDVRPPLVLLKTIDYLESLLDRTDFSFSEIHKFVRDRSRSVRQDLTLQHERGRNSVLIHEHIARFHIYSGHYLCELDAAEFDAFQNTEQLRKVLQSLHEMYNDEPGVHENEPEFRCYYVLTHLKDADIYRKTLSFTKQVFQSGHVQFALACCNAYREDDYVRFFGLVKKGKIIIEFLKGPYLAACLLHGFIISMRQRSFQIMCKAYRYNEGFPLNEIIDMFLFENEQEATTMCKSVGLGIDCGKVFFTSVIEPGEAFKPKRSEKWVERKKPFKNISEIVRIAIPFDKSDKIVDTEMNLSVPISSFASPSFASPSFVSPSTPFASSNSSQFNSVTNKPPTISPVEMNSISNQLLDNLLSFTVSSLLNNLTQQVYDFAMTESIKDFLLRESNTIFYSMLNSTIPSLLFSICVKEWKRKHELEVLKQSITNTKLDGIIDETIRSLCLSVSLISVADCKYANTLLIPLISLWRKRVNMILSAKEKVATEVHRKKRVASLLSSISLTPRVDRLIARDVNVSKKPFIARKYTIEPLNIPLLVKEHLVPPLNGLDDRFFKLIIVTNDVESNSILHWIACLLKKGVNRSNSCLSLYLHDNVHVSVAVCQNLSQVNLKGTIGVISIGRLGSIDMLKSIDHYITCLELNQVNYTTNDTTIGKILLKSLDFSHPRIISKALTDSWTEKLKNELVLMCSRYKNKVTLTKIFIQDLLLIRFMALLCNVIYQPFRAVHSDDALMPFCIESVNCFLKKLKNVVQNPLLLSLNIPAPEFDRKSPIPIDWQKRVVACGDIIKSYWWKPYYGSLDEWIASHQWMAMLEVNKDDLFELVVFLLESMVISLTSSIDPVWIVEEHAEYFLFQECLQEIKKKWISLDRKRKFVDTILVKTEKKRTNNISLENVKNSLSLEKKNSSEFENQLKLLLE